MENFDKWARFYDIIYHGYKEDIEFYKKEAKKARGKVLEIVCGTGRIYLELLKEGIDSYGIDISKGMLKILEKKAQRLGLKVKVHRANCQNFKLRNRFSLIVFPFSSFLLNLTINEQLKTLKNIKKHLLPNGKLILDFLFPTPKFIVKNYGKEMKKSIKTSEGKFILINKSHFIDEPNQMVEFIGTLIKNNKVIWKDKFRIVFVYKREFELLLKLTGFKKWKVYGGFNYKQLISSNQRMVWIVS